MKKDSLATKRAKERGYFDNGPEWYCEFRTGEVTGIGYEEGVNRRDPTAVILVDGLYYTWYTYNVGPHVGFGTGDEGAKVWPWDRSDIWYATSKDGINWEEQGLAVHRGEAGAYDDRSVFTPEIMVHEGKYYLVYQAVQHPYMRRTYNTVGMAVADKPEGPWSKLDAPILEPAKDGEWLGDTDNNLLIKKRGSFDSHKVHDPVLFFYNNKFYLYYKGEPMGEQMFMGGRETKWGLAIADKVEGPYVKSDYNPVSNGGHETFLWPYKGGMVGLLSTDGMERNTFQFAKDGINFEIMSAVKWVPEASGPYREYSDSEPMCGCQWGLCHHLDKDWNYISRFDIDTTAKDYFESKAEFRLQHGWDGLMDKEKG